MKIKLNSNILKKILFISISLFLLLDVYSQDIKLFNEIKTTSNFIEVDNFGSLYAVSDYSIIKFNTNGEILAEYENDLYGKIHSVDISNSLKILVFYKDFLELEYLDNRLTKINTNHLNESQLSEISIVAYSRDDRLWIIDQSDFKLKKIDKQFNVIYENELNFSRELQNTARIQEYEDKLIILTDKGIKQFDLFGNLIFEMNKSKITDFQILDNKIIYFHENTLLSLDIRTKSEITLLKIELKEAERIKLLKNMIVLYTPNKVALYKYDE